MVFTSVSHLCFTLGVFLEQHYFTVRAPVRASVVRPYVRHALLQKHWAEFNQTCYITSPNGKGVQEQHYFSVRPVVRVSVV